jgi:hypothetical protein
MSHQQITQVSFVPLIKLNDRLTSNPQYDLEQVC